MFYKEPFVFSVSSLFLQIFAVKFYGQTMGLTYAIAVVN